MKKVQVKYCYTEKETNDFLKTLGVSGVESAVGMPMLHSIQYCPKQKGQTFEYNTEEGQRSEMSITTDVIAIVQYIVDEEK